MVNNTAEQRWQPPTSSNHAKVKPTPIMPKNHVHQVDIEPATITTPQATQATPNRLTGKQKAFIKLFLEQPQLSLYEIAEQAGYTGNKHTLSQTAGENLNKPEILRELAKHSDLAEITLIEVLQQSKKQMYNDKQARAVDWANTARMTAQDVLDRIHGKATQKSEVTTKAVVLNIDLTGATGANS